jgi:hypothetical protein
VGWSEIWDVKSTENNKIWNGGLNGVCGAVLGYICKMKIYADKGQKLEDTVLSVLDRN